MTEESPVELRDELADEIRDQFRLRLGERVAGEPVMLSEAEADEIADIALTVFDEAARERMAEHLLAETRLKAMDFRNGASMDIVPAQEIAALWVAAARRILDTAPNYMECTFEIGSAGERYVLTVQRPGKLTPHEARQAAEKRADEAEQANAQFGGSLLDILGEFSHDPAQTLAIIEEMLTGAKEQER